MRGDAPILTVLEALPGAKAQSSGRWRARCPAHEDAHPSLDWRLGTDGRVLLICRAGCVTEAVMEALGCTMADLFPPEDDRPAPPAGHAVITDYEIRDDAGTLVAIHRRHDRPVGRSRARPARKRPGSSPAGHVCLSGC